MGQHEARVAACIVGAGGVAPFGRDGRARLERQLPRLGFATVESPGEADLLISCEVLFGGSVLAALGGAAPGTLLLDDAGRLAAARRQAGNGPLLDTARGGPVPTPPAASGVPADPQALAAAVAAGQRMPAGTGISGAALAGRYDAKLRKRADPTVMRLDDRGRAEAALFDASYKGVTDLVTKHVWPAPALVVTRWCAARGITPNQVTWASAVLMALAFWLFWEGWFGTGLVLAWAMTFLDTVDGKLARVTLSSSRFGDVLDHGIDLVHPPFWWWAWAVGCAAVGQPVAWWVVPAIVGGYVLQRGEEGLFLARFGVEMHVWRRFDSLFRQVTARRNPNLLILTVATFAGAPGAGLVAVAIWTVLCLLVHAVRIAQAFAAARTAPLVPWLALA